MTKIDDILNGQKYKKVVTPDGMIHNIPIDVDENIVMRSIDEMAEGTSDFITFTSRADAEKWGDDLFRTWREGLSDMETEAILEYTGDRSKNINAVLRGSELEYINDNAMYVEELTNAIGRRIY